MKKLVYQNGEAVLADATEEDEAALHRILDDSIYVTIMYGIACSRCRHAVQNVIVHGRRHNYWCRAFPEGIPEEIYTGKNGHTEPYRGDHGIQFEQKQA